MTQEFSIKEEVYKCSKCGLCQSVCPIFISVKNEMLLPRGRFIILNNLFNNGKKLGKKFLSQLDICLKCNKCKDFCPSNIDSYKIFTLLQSKYIKFHRFSALFFIAMPIISVFIKIARILNFYPDKYTQNICKPIVKRKKIQKSLNKKVVYFEGCFNKYINPSDKNAALNLIEKTGFSIQKIIHLCCGYPYLSDGNLSKFKQNAQKIINSVPDDCEYIICSCDTCFDTLNRFSDYTDNIPDFKRKLITLDEFLKINDFNVKLSTENVVYHKPLLRSSICYPLYDVIQINTKYNATLMENFLWYKNIPQTLKKKLAEDIFYNNDQIEGKTILTSCLISKWGLLRGLHYKNINANTLTTAEFIELNSLL